MKRYWHRFFQGSSLQLENIADKSIALIVTSPPYPMIEMWDESFGSQNEEIRNAISAEQYQLAFLKMHELLESVWSECDRVLIDNGFVCINIGDATRTVQGSFRLYPNHARIIDYFTSHGYCMLPDIHWRKPTNAPNKFMGSGMYPAGAYVTFEHEYILIFRKGSKRVFNRIDMPLRHESAYFWEERNVWFSDLWEINGTSQAGKQANARKRSAAFPLEIPYRLVNMYSVKGDTILDPFCGSGTTNLACAASERNSIGIDLDEVMISCAMDTLLNGQSLVNGIISRRLDSHRRYIHSLSPEKLNKCYINDFHGFPVKTLQERKLIIRACAKIAMEGQVIYSCFDN